MIPCSTYTGRTCNANRQRLTKHSEHSTSRFVTTSIAISLSLFLCLHNIHYPSFRGMIFIPLRSDPYLSLACKYSQGQICCQELRATAYRCSCLRVHQHKCAALLGYFTQGPQLLRLHKFFQVNLPIL